MMTCRYQRHRVSLQQQQKNSGTDWAMPQSHTQDHGAVTMKMNRSALQQMLQKKKG
jgi:hypothetical protein